MGWEATHSAGWPLAGLGDAAAMMSDLAAHPQRGVLGCPLLFLERSGMNGWDVMDSLDGWIHSMKSNHWTMR